MSVDLIGNGYIFIVDTEEYAGNVEREMCAFMTGVLGECGVGIEAATQYAKDMGLKMGKYGIENNPYDNLLNQIADDHGCRRPASIWPTPGWYNNGLGEHYRDKGNEAKALSAYVRSTEEYANDQIKMVESYSDAEDTPENRQKGAWTKKAKEQHRKRYEAEIAKAKAMTKVHRYPAYLSVAIFFQKKPTKKQIEFLKGRAYEFAKDTMRFSRFSHKEKTPVKITGFRLLEVIPEQYKEIEVQ